MRRVVVEIAVAESAVVADAQVKRAHGRTARARLQLRTCARTCARRRRKLIGHLQDALGVSVQRQADAQLSIATVIGRLALGRIWNTIVHTSTSSSGCSYFEQLTKIWSSITLTITSAYYISQIPVYICRKGIIVSSIYWATAHVGLHSESATWEKLALSTAVANVLSSAAATAKVVIVVPTKRQITSPVDDFPSTVRMKGQIDIDLHGWRKLTQVYYRQSI